MDPSVAQNWSEQMHSHHARQIWWSLLPFTIISSTCTSNDFIICHNELTSYRLRLCTMHLSSPTHTSMSTFDIISHSRSKHAPITDLGLLWSSYNNQHYHIIFPLCIAFINYRNLFGFRDLWYGSNHSFFSLNGLIIQQFEVRKYFIF